MAVRFIVLLFEGSFIQLLKTEGTDEMFGVKLAVHGCYTPPSDGFLTAVAKGATMSMVMDLTVRHALMIKETSIMKRLMTFHASETLGVPVTIERSDVVVEDCIIAS